MKKILFLLAVLKTTFIFSQSDSFSDGFREGFNSYIIEKNGSVNFNYTNYLQNNDCKKNVYVNDPKAKEKIYADGYKCGISQAVKALTEFQNNKPIVKSNQVKTIESIDNEISELELKEQSSYSTQKEAYKNQIIALEQEKKELINSKKEKKKQLEQQNEENDRIKSKNEQTTQSKNNIDYQKQLNELNENNRINNERMINDFSNNLNQLSSGMQNALIQQAKNDLRQREIIMRNLYGLNSNKLNSIVNFYNSIDKRAFNKDVTGLFKGNIISNKKYIYYPNGNITTVDDCILNVKNNQLINIYLNGNAEMEIKLPSDFPNQSFFNNGVVRYNDINTYQTIDVLMLEPYIQNNSNNTLKENEIGNVIIYSTNKKDEGRIIHLQEINLENNTLLRETEVKVIYAKNEKELIEKNNQTKTPVYVDRKINYLCDATTTPFGYIPLHAKTNNKVLEPLKQGEIRYVKIGYRDRD